MPCRSPLVASTAGRRNSLRSNISPPVSLCCSAARCATSGCPIFDITIAAVTCRLAEGETRQLLFLLTPRWPASYSLFLLFSLLPLYSKKGAKKRASVVVSRHGLCSQVASDILRSHVPCRSPLVASTAGRRNSLRSNISPPVSLCCSAARCATLGCPNIRHYHCYGYVPSC